MASTTEHMRGHRGAQTADRLLRRAPTALSTQTNCDTSGRPFTSCVFQRLLTRPSSHTASYFFFGFSAPPLRKRASIRQSAMQMVAAMTEGLGTGMEST